MRKTNEATSKNNDINAVLPNKVSNLDIKANFAKKFPWFGMIF